MLRPHRSWVAVLACLLSLPVLRADVDLFDGQGKAAAIVDAKGRIVAYDGNVIGFLTRMPSGPSAVYNNEGRQVGWFESGAYHNMEGKAVWAVKGRHMGVTEIPPVRPVGRVGPIQGVPDVPGVAPIFSTEFETPARRRDSLALPQSSVVLPEFRPSDAGAATSASILGSVDAVGRMAERRQRMQAEAIAAEQRAVQHEREMAAMDLEIARGRAELEQRQRESRARMEVIERETRRLEERTTMLEALNKGDGIFVATRALPELAMDEGDVLRMGVASPDGLARVQKMDASPDRRLFANRQFSQGVAGASLNPWSSANEPLTLLYARARDGSLRSLTEAANEEHLKLVGQWRAEATKIHRQLSETIYFMAAVALPEIDAAVGSRVEYVQPTPTGVGLVINGNRKFLESVPAATVARWLEEKRIVAAPDPLAVPGR